VSKYLITFCYTSYESVEVEANDSDEAREKAYDQALCAVTSDCYEIVDCTEISE
jgi:hypothetical protein